MNLELSPNPIFYDIYSPKVIVIEGIDGSGKTALCKSLTSVKPPTWGNLEGLEVYFAPEPGWTKVGVEVRKLIKGGPGELNPRIQHLLIEAARIQALFSIQNKLNYASRDGYPVKYILDRHSDSTWAYQGAMGVPDDYINQVQNGYSDLIGPDITIFLDVNTRIAEGRRISRGNLDSIDDKPISFYDIVRKRYWGRIMEDRNSYYVVNADRSAEEVSTEVTTFLSSLETPKEYRK
jgi:dTMP kinase